jgi:aspartyl-tRNA(Asn)/glutamyl-tRNA(Gln) amidotransferase subunit C
VEPTSHVIPMQNVLREDAVKPSLPHDEALANAPDVDAGCFRVPKIIE